MSRLAGWRQLLRFVLAPPAGRPAWLPDWSTVRPQAACLGGLPGWMRPEWSVQTWSVQTWSVQAWPVRVRLVRATAQRASAARASRRSALLPGSACRPRGSGRQSAVQRLAARWPRRDWRLRVRCRQGPLPVEPDNRWSAPGCGMRLDRHRELAWPKAPAMSGCPVPPVHLAPSARLVPWAQSRRSTREARWAARPAGTLAGLAACRRRAAAVIRPEMPGRALPCVPPVRLSGAPAVAVGVDAGVSARRPAAPDCGRLGGPRRKSGLPEPVRRWAEVAGRLAC